MTTRSLNRMKYLIFTFLSCYHNDVVSQQMSEFVNLQISTEKGLNRDHITLNCTSMQETFDSSAEFIIDNITRANIRASHGVCYILRRACAATECSCTSRMYIWTFPTSTIGKQFHTLTCQLRFQEKNINSHVQVYKTKIYNGSGRKIAAKGEGKTTPHIEQKIDRMSGDKPEELLLTRELQRSHTFLDTPVNELETQKNSAMYLSMSDESANIEGGKLFGLYNMGMNC
ncbi:unnamed protein product [Mytilus coruscus]|uniref:Uncharacterized protein n=1 Tax=Mytilus coruscus TaxID=42192 RepID=A0A6J8E105_MYTCO|nr:unnamed protein product [Mytilus coruscus]